LLKYTFRSLNGSPQKLKLHPEQNDPVKTSSCTSIAMHLLANQWLSLQPTSCTPKSQATSRAYAW
jgi:hypothetical protein